MQFDQSELDRLRQWFDALMDVNPEYLDSGDVELGIRLYEARGMRPSKDMLTKSGS